MPTLALREEHWQVIVEMLELPVETGGFILAGITYDEDDLTLFGRTLHWVPDEHYAERGRDGLAIASRWYWPLFGRAQRDDAVPIFIHTHPEARPKPSIRDEAADRGLWANAIARSRAPFYVSLIVGGTSEKPTFTGRIYDADGRVTPLARLRVIGRRLRLLLAAGLGDPEIDAELYDRQILAFGEAGQKLLARLRVGVVGAGGTGSAVFEQLVRIGITNITTIDDDVVTRTNLTRIHESGRSDVGRSKVEVMYRAAGRIGLGTKVDPVEGRITDPATGARLRHLDVIFGCTDDEKGRNLLSRLALTHLIQVFDLAFAVDPNEDGTIRGLTGRLTVLLPGQACLLCRGRITAEGLMAEDLDPEERRRRAGEGYVPGLDENDPAVCAYTTLIASYAVNELLDRLFAYSDGVERFQSSEMLVMLADRRLGFNSRPASATHWCGDPDTVGRGDAAR
jgi:molybdopterin/thiamine biosynthesis adenylyltransferase